MPSAELVSTAVNLDDAWTRPLTARLAAELYERTASTDDWASRFAALDDVLRRAIAAHDDSVVNGAPAAATDAWRLIGATLGTRRISDVAGELGWSRRHLSERFTEEFGLPPKTMASIVRFERSLRLLKRPVPPRLAAVAAACGYTDQAHLSRDWHRFAGTTPTAWRAGEQLPFVQDLDAT